MSAYRKESCVRLSYVLEEEDLERSARPILEEWAHRGRLSIGATVALSGIVFIATMPAIAATVALVVASATAAWYGTKVKIVRSAIARYGRTWEDRRHVEVEITEDLFRVTDRAGELRLAWEMILHWRETQDDFLIYTNPEAVHAIPKRAFSSAEQEVTLRQLLSDRVAAGGERAVSAGMRTLWMPLVAFHVAATLFFAGVIEAVAHILS